MRAPGGFDGEAYGDYSAVGGGYMTYQGMNFGYQVERPGPVPQRVVTPRPVDPAPR